jgi:hypothetical protein
LRRYKNPNPPCLAGRESLLPCPSYFPKARGYQSSSGGHAKPAEQSRYIAADLLVTVQELSADRNELHLVAHFVDLFGDQRFDSHDFLDTVHLNRWGGGKLISVLAQELAKNGDIYCCFRQSRHRATNKQSVRNHKNNGNELSSPSLSFSQ